MGTSYTLKAGYHVYNRQKKQYNDECEYLTLKFDKLKKECGGKYFKEIFLRS